MLNPFVLARLASLGHSNAPRVYKGNGGQRSCYQPHQGARECARRKAQQHV